MWKFKKNFINCAIEIEFTWRNVLPSSRNKRNGTSKSIELRNSTHPLGVKYCDPDTAHIGALIPINRNKCDC